MDLPPELHRLSRMLMLPFSVGLIVGIARVIQDRHGGWWQALWGMASADFSRRCAKTLWACCASCALSGAVTSDYRR